MRYFKFLCCALCVLVAAGPCWSGPLGKWFKYIPGKASHLPPEGYFRNQPLPDLSEQICAQIGKGYEKPLPSENMNDLFLEQVQNDYFIPFVPPSTVFLDDFPEPELEPASDEFYSSDIRKLVEKPQMPDFEPVRSSEITDSDDFNVYYVPQDAHDKMTERQQLKTHTSVLAKNAVSRQKIMSRIQNFVTLYPFERRPFEEIYQKSSVLFSIRPDDTVPVDYEFLPKEEQQQYQLETQADFYFNQLPYAFLIFTPGFIRDDYRQQSVIYYISVLSSPKMPLHQRIRSFTLLSFLSISGDRIDGIPVEDVIVNSLRQDFENPPWTVDYAAAMALLNLGAPEKIQELVQWRMQLEANKEQRTPGISYLYQNIFGEYDLKVQDLGAFPRMRPDSPEELKIALHQLNEIRSHIFECSAEELMWKLSSLKDITDFLQLKGSVPQQELLEEDTDELPGNIPQE